MKIDSCIEQKLIIEVDIAPEFDHCHDGVCLRDSDDISLFVNYSESEDCFDGFSIFQGKDIVRFRLTNQQYELKELESYSKRININDFSSLKKGIGNASIYGLLAVTTKDNLFEYYVGELVTVSRENILLNLVDENGRKLSSIGIDVKDIAYITFNTKYLKEVKKNQGASAR